MESYVAIVAGALFAAGIYLLLQRTLAQLILGLALISNGANLAIFTAAGLRWGEPPLIPEGATRLAGPAADPVPQALILTAIVIGFGTLAFTTALVHRVHQTVGTDNLDDMRATDLLDPSSGATDKS
ncbi:MAG: NADH-quinone oxidoreductase subunit K [Chloroflexota bacterium]|nr:NADH-quinone oxidoreductase subunit K [Dehalococcoidia bacterium]MDW8252630.1 NADH-quinone oxidoreductase subunit K [Chloroflexota bacterium]